jgi:outer membrane protein
MRLLFIKYLCASIFIFSWLLFPSPVFTATIPLNLNEAVSKALRASEDCQIQENELLKSEYKTRETTSILFPQITGDLTYVNNVKYPDIPTTRFVKNHNFDAGISINQIITSFGKISSSISAMKKLAGMNKHKKESVKDETVFNTKLLYFNAYFAKKNLQITKESYENTLKNKALLEKQSASGRLSKRDNIKVAADVAARIPMMRTAESTYAIAMETLKRNLGMPYDCALELTEGYRTEYKNFDIKEALGRLEKHQPILKALLKSIEAQESLITSKKAEYFPTLSAFFKCNYKGSSDDYFIGNDALYNYHVFGLNLQIPLFYGNRTSYKIKQSNADKNNTILTYQKTKKNLELELDKAITEYNELINTLPSNQEAIDLAQESFDLSQKLFVSGQLSATDLNDAEMMLTSQKLKKEASLFKLQVALAKIERLSCIGTIYE